MFVKPFKTKSNNQLKSSDRKKVKQKVSAVFPNITEAQLDEIFPSKSNVFSIRIITHQEQQLTVYTADKRPMFFEVTEKEIYPTVYTLWIVPNLIPVFTTDSSVLPILAKGADLMAPGVLRKGDGAKSWGHHRKGEIVAVNLSSNKSCCAVGSLNRSSEDIYMSGGHGVCVNIKHVFGDKLWSIEPSACLQIPVAEAAYQPPKACDFPALGQEKEKKVKVEPIVEPSKAPEEATNGIEGLCLDDLEDVDGDEGDEDEGQDTPDVILRRAFLTVLKTQGKSLKLPLLVSTFYATHVQPACEPKVDIKQTSFKKLGKFLAQMATEGFITIRQEQKGVEQVASIQHDHPDLAAFIPVASTSNQDTAAAAAAPQTHVLLNAMTKVFTITEATYPFFAYFQMSVDANLVEEQVVKCFKEYTLKNKLQDPLDRSKIVPDKVLQTVFGQAEGEATSITFPQGLNALFSKMPSKYEMRSAAVASKAGKIPAIQMVLKKCSGNKKVTLVTNLEAYGIILNEFAKQCKLAVQASSTINQAKDTKLNQLLVQGNQIRFIHTLLTETYKVPANRITGLEFAKKDPKKK